MDETIFYVDDTTFFVDEILSSVERFGFWKARSFLGGQIPP
jgi:hypothetical protein